MRQPLRYTGILLSYLPEVKREHERMLTLAVANGIALMFTAEDRDRERILAALGIEDEEPEALSPEQLRAQLAGIGMVEACPKSSA